MLCAHCGAPIRHVKEAEGWLHSEPLEDFRISRCELQDVLADPPHPGAVLHRQTVIHPAQPRLRAGDNEYLARFETEEISSP